MSPNKIAWCMIVKGTSDEAKLLEQCLKSLEGHVDKLFIDINHLPGKKVSPKVLKVAQKYGADIKETIWTGNFVTARTDNFARVPKEYNFIGWCDSDDTIDSPEQIRYVINAMDSSCQGVYANYDYDHDEDGNVTLQHWVARIVRNNEAYIWKSSMLDGEVSVHETLNEVIPRGKIMSNDFKIVHHSNADRRLSSLIRNIELLEKMFKKQEKAGKFDPRTMFYLATHYYDANNLEDAKLLLMNYMKISGWPEERCEALVYLGNILFRQGDDDQAHRMYLMAIGEYQNSPRPYVGLAELDFVKGRYGESASWIEKCLQLPEETTTMVKMPMENSFKAYMLGAQACMNIGGKSLNKAVDYIKKAMKLRPTDVDVLRAKELVEGLVSNRDNIKASVRLIKKLEVDNEPERVLPFINTLPSVVQSNPIILNYRFKYTEAKKWAKQSIALYVGQGPLGNWGPWSLKDGIGGSEEAVIQLSRQLANLGWLVTVFATPGNRAGYDSINIEWKQYYEFNPNDEYDVLIAWRNPGFFDNKFKARKQYLWLHDVMLKEEFLPERLENIDKVIFVGQYHADLYKGIIPDEKIFVSSNGIDAVAFQEPAGKRVAHRMVYMSSYNRGLKILLNNWPEIKKAIPDATLDVYYGWQSYDSINQSNPERMQWKEDLVKLMDSCEGVTDHGRIGHTQIIKEIKTADVFAYPCVFDEVYCISYVKAMAGGAWPVSSDFAELVTYKDDGGVQVHYEEGKLDEFGKNYTSQLIKTLKKGVTKKEREAMSALALSKYTWSRTAESWSSEFLK
jgi:tetratricopeptide (TPR) repeat protein